MLYKENLPNLNDQEIYSYWCMQKLRLRKGNTLYFFINFEYFDAFTIGPNN